MQTPGRAHSHWVSCACANALPYGRASETRQAPGNRISGRPRQLGNNDSKTVYELAENDLARVFHQAFAKVSG